MRDLYRQLLSFINFENIFDALAAVAYVIVYFTSRDQFLAGISALLITAINIAYQLKFKSRVLGRSYIFLCLESLGVLSDIVEKVGILWHWRILIFSWICSVAWYVAFRLLKIDIISNLFGPSYKVSRHGAIRINTLSPVFFVFVGIFAVTLGSYLAPEDFDTYWTKIAIALTVAYAIAVTLPFYLKGDLKKVEHSQ